MNEILKEMTDLLASKSFRFKILSLEHLDELKGELIDRFNNKEFDERFYEVELKRLENQKPENFPEAKSIIIIAGTQPIDLVTFNYKGKSHLVKIPPTYRYYKPPNEPEVFIPELLKKHGYNVKPAIMPYKLTAVRSGLSEYGRNNITYIKDWGSFYRLDCFYSDMPVFEDNWQKPKMMKSCEKCHLCRDNCPTGAIGDDRFLFHGEKCLTYHNENNWEFANWINPEWHNCWVGCLKCQEICPADQKVKNWQINRVEFSEKETELILNGLKAEDLLEEMKRKLEELTMIEYIPLLSRNLRILLKV